MTVIRPHCRLHFTAADVEFILAAIGRRASDSGALRQLLADDTSRDQLLDSPDLCRAVLEGAGCLTISPHLYFYVLVRHALREAGVESREVADYVAELLAEFMWTERTRARLPGEPQPLDYFYEMLAALPRVDERQAFALRTHIGNQALYYSGLFNERIAQRARRRGFPDIGYYEGLGEASFAAASHDRWALRLGLAEVFALLAAGFHRTRLALNDLAERLVSLGDDGSRYDRLLIQARGVS
ncbi:MAG: hypothetical protein KF791_06800 [Verrucomicrobiae bacterium]|nr:hypothetical protein [Verrucomicrobiae bacterium]